MPIYIKIISAGNIKMRNGMRNKLKIGGGVIFPNFPEISGYTSALSITNITITVIKSEIKIGVQAL